MPIATGLALGIGAAAAAAGSVGSAVIGSHAAGKAAGAQAGAADYAANLQAQEAQNALNFQQQVFNTQQQNLAPWLQTGAGALGNLGYLLGINPNTSIGQPAGGMYSGQPAISRGSLPNTAPGLSAPNINAGNNMVAKPYSYSAAGRPFPGTSPVAGAPGLNNPITGATRGGAPQLGALAGAPAPGVAGIQPGAAPSAGNPLAAGGFGSLMTPFSQQFTAPTDVTEQNDPGYQFRLKQGQQLLENSAAARGGLLSGTTGEALMNYGQDYASNEYNNVYNRALGQYQQNYNIYNQNQANQFNRLAALAGVGQTAAGQLGSFGSQAAGNVGNILSNAGQQIGNAAQNAGAATASGYVGQSNALTGGLSGITGSLGNSLLLSSLLGGQGGGGSPGAINPLAFDSATGGGMFG